MLSSASGMNDRPAGSVDFSARDERAKSRQKWLLDLGSLMLPASAAMPADEPFGRGAATQPALVAMLPAVVAAAFSSASQLKMWVPVLCAES